MAAILTDGRHRIYNNTNFNNYSLPEPSRALNGQHKMKYNY